MKRFASFGLALAAFAALSAAAVAEPLVSGARGCVREGYADTYDSTQRREDPVGFKVLGKGPTMRTARRAREIMLELELFKQFTPSGLLGPPIDAPLRIFVVPDSDAVGAYGLVLPYCRHVTTGRLSAVLIHTEISDADLVQALAHELFHASSVDRRPAPPSKTGNGWFEEAAATWGEAKVIHDPDAAESRDDLFIGRPAEALDEWDGFGDEEDAFDHAYGAYRFLQHLETYIGETAMYSVIRDVNSRRGVDDADSERDTTLLARELADRGFDLGEQLGAFWGEHLQATVANGPRAPTTSIAPAVAGTTKAYDVSVSRLSARIVDVEVPPGVRQLEVTVEALPPDGHAWLRDNELVYEVSSIGDTVRFCVGGSDPGARPWPGHGKMRLAFTNGQSDPSAGELEFGITIDADEPACAGPDEEPAPGEFDVVRLPGGCPRAPEAYAVGGDTHYRVYGERFFVAYADVGKWVFLETLRARRTLAYLRGSARALRVIARRIGRRYRCAARRLRRISPVPDDEIVKLARGAISGYFIRAARAIEAQDQERMRNQLEKAGSNLVKLQARVTACNSAIKARQAKKANCDEAGD